MSLEYARLCVVDASGKIVREGKVSGPVTLITWLGSLGVNLERIGLEAGGLRNGFMGRCGKRGWRWRHRGSLAFSPHFQLTIQWLILAGFLGFPLLLSLSAECQLEIAVANCAACRW